MTTRAEAAVLKAAQAILAKRGGQARAAKLTAARRRAIARQGGLASAAKRWGTKRTKKGGGSR